MSMYTYFQREAKDLHSLGSCLKEREIEKANKLVKIAIKQKKVVAHDQQQYLASAQPL